MIESVWSCLPATPDSKYPSPPTTTISSSRSTKSGRTTCARGGSRLGDAIEVASQSFLTKLNAHKAMVIFTDGEDQESGPVEVARKTHTETGVRIFTVGLGDMERGARIPIHSGNGGEFLQHEGEQVWSKLDGDVLRQVAIDTGGAYVPAGTKQVNMSDVYHHYIADVEQTEFETARINQYEARFQWFLAPALLLLLLEVVIVTWPRRHPDSVARAAAARREQQLPPSELAPTEQSTAA